MENSKKQGNKDNGKRFCKCYTCKDSEFNYGNNPVLIEDWNPLIFQFFGRDLVK